MMSRWLILGTCNTGYLTRLIEIYFVTFESLK